MRARSNSALLLAGLALVSAGNAPAGEPAAEPATENVPAFAPAPDSPIADSARPETTIAAPANLEESLRSLQARAQLSTTKRASQNLADVPMTLSWIPAEELQGSGAFSLCDAIQYFPGLECRRGAMRQASVSARGLGSNFLSNRILLLKDGRPQTDPWTGIFYPDETTPLSNVKQIEVVRGPGSSLYGSSAFGGVINVISRSPADLLRGRPVAAEARVTGGQYGTFRAQAQVAAQVGVAQALFGYHGFTSEGPPLFSDPDRGVIDRNQWSKVQQGTARVNLGPLRLDAEYTNSAVGRPGGTQISTIGNCGRCHYTARDSELGEVLTAGAGLDAKVADWLRLALDGYAYFKRRQVDLENGVTGQMQPTIGKRRRLGGEARAMVTAGPLDVTLGADAKLDLSNNLNILTTLEPGRDTQGTSLGAFADAEVRPWRSLVLGGGVRYDTFRYPEALWKNQASHLSPRASVVFHALPQLTLRGNYGHAFRAPTMAELGISSQMFASTLLGNPYLLPETLDAFEVAVDTWPVGDSLRLTATGFADFARNFINEELIAAVTSRFANVGDARVLGVEVEASARVPAIHGSFDVGYQYLDARQLATAANPEEPLDYAPHHRLSLRARGRPSAKTFVDLYALFVGERQDPGKKVDAAGVNTTHIVLPPYFVANARVGWEVSPQLTTSVIATNLFNSQYQEMHGFPAPGLQVFAELELRQ